MLQVRQGVFETNSSSTHSITFASQSEFNEWAAGNVYLNECWFYSEFNENKDKEFVTKEEAISLVMSSDSLPEQNPYEMPEEELDEILADEYCIYSYEKFFNDWGMETYKECYTTEHGDNIVAFGKYGYS